MRGRLDDEKLETLRGWGTGLASEGRDELRAAGKAILILIEEIDRLQVDVWRARQEAPAEESQQESESVSDQPSAADRPETAPTLEGSLRRRLLWLKRNPLARGPSV